MKNLKLMLLGFILFVFCIKTSYGEIVRAPGVISPAIIKEVCEHTYSNKEIKALEKAANKGDSHAQLTLAILYNIRSTYKYQQVKDNPKASSSENFISRVLSEHLSSPCNRYQK